MARSHILKAFSDLESALWIHKYHPGLTIKQMVRTAQDTPSLIQHAMKLFSC